MSPEAYTVVGSVLVALIAGPLAIVVTKFANRANAATAVTQSQQVTPGVQAQVDALVSTVNSLSEMNAETRAQVETLKREREEDRRVISALARYASGLLAYIHQHVDRDDAPNPPAELHGLLEQPRDRRYHDIPHDGPERRRRP